MVCFYLRRTRWPEVVAGKQIGAGVLANFCDFWTHIIFHELPDYPFFLSIKWGETIPDIIPGEPRSIKLHKLPLRVIRVSYRHWLIPTFLFIMSPDTAFVADERQPFVLKL